MYGSVCLLCDLSGLLSGVHRNLASCESGTEFSAQGHLWPEKIGRQVLSMRCNQKGFGGSVEKPYLPYEATGYLQGVLTDHPWLCADKYGS